MVIGDRWGLRGFLVVFLSVDSGMLEVTRLDGFGGIPPAGVLRLIVFVKVVILIGVGGVLRGGFFHEL